MDKELKALLEQANKAYKENFPNETWFERALFFSWSCSIKDCTFCYMSTQDRKNKDEEDRAVRSKESLYAEAILCKTLGWRIGFFSGGINAYKHDEIAEMLRVISTITGEKLWINLGATPEAYLEKYLPYIQGVVGSIETVNENIHTQVCPSKPTAPYRKMFEYSAKLGLKNAMTIILGIGETKEDFGALKEFIKKYKIEKLHLYALNPVKGTPFEKKGSPNPEYQAWYIAKTRTAFPKLDIQMGIWKDKIDRIPLLLEAGANSISKFPATRDFGSKEAKIIQELSAKAGRNFLGSLTKLPKTDWDAEVEKIPCSGATKKIVRQKLQQYLNRMNSHSS
jgi:biotin synthase-like enzyme